MWAAAGALGAAAGPALGGLLTQTISWQAIFIVQVPLAIAALLAVPADAAARRRRCRRPPPTARTSPPTSPWACCRRRSTAALFLVVLLLINGWGHTPLTAAAVVTVMPMARR